MSRLSKKPKISQNPKHPPDTLAPLTRRPLQALESSVMDDRWMSRLSKKPKISQNPKHPRDTPAPLTRRPLQALESSVRMTDG